MKLFSFICLGAWWLGWIILGVVTLLFAILIGLFPKYLPKKMEKQNVGEYEFGKTRDQSAEIEDISYTGNSTDEDVNLKSEFTIKLYV